MPPAMPPAMPPVLSPSENETCLITSCNYHFKLNKSSCQCEELIGAICYIGCPTGMTVYAVPGRVNCECIDIIICPIESCASSADLIDCKCQKKFLIPFPLLSPMVDLETLPEQELEPVL